MHNFEDYLKKEIINLINPSKTPIVKSKCERNKSIKKIAPLVQSFAKNEHEYWKSFSRAQPTVIPNSKNNSPNINKTRKSLKRCQSEFYRDLLKSEQNLNEKRSNQQNSSISARKRIDTQATNSTRRRQVLDSHKQPRKIGELMNLQLMKRQSSTASDNYLKAKLEFSKNRPSSSMGSFNIIKI